MGYWIYGLNNNICHGPASEQLVKKWKERDKNFIEYQQSCAILKVVLKKRTDLPYG